MITPEQITQLQSRHAELSEKLSQSDILSDQNTYARISKEYRALDDIIQAIEKQQELHVALTEARAIIAEKDDDDFVALAKAEEETLLQALKATEDKINEYINPADPYDKKNIIMEIRAGAGGDEAALFAGELFRMYTLYSESRGWRVILISSNQTGIGGFKEIIFSVEGDNVYRYLKYEGGVHRVQRVPETEKSGRVHTSTVTVAVLPEAEDVDVKIEPKDIRVDTYCSSGAGGQSVNTTYSAVRVTHIPTGIVVTCQDERSQQSNRERALTVLRSRILDEQLQKASQERASHRKQMVGTGDRAEKIRTYNFPQDRITDHRIKESWHSISDSMNGAITPIIFALQAADAQLKSSENKSE